MRLTQSTVHNTYRTAGLALAVLLLGACGDKPAPVTPPASSESPAAATGNASTDAPAALTVVNFSPNTTPAGTPFNVQRDGNSGISFELNRTTIDPVKLWFDGKPMLDGNVTGVIVTSTIPVDYMAAAGDYPIELEVAGVRIPAGNFTVTPR